GVSRPSSSRDEPAVFMPGHMSLCIKGFARSDFLSVALPEQVSDEKCQLGRDPFSVSLRILRFGRNGGRRRGIKHQCVQQSHACSSGRADGPGVIDGQGSQRSPRGCWAVQTMKTKESSVTALTVRRALLAIVLASTLAGCNQKSGAAAGPPPPTVKVVTVTEQDVPISVEYVGTLVGYINAQIRARVSGHLMSQNYKEGSPVKAGDLLFQVDPRPFQAALDQAEAQLLQAESQLSQAKAQVAASQAQVEQAIAKVAQDEAQVKRSEAEQRRTELDVGRYTPLAQRGSVSQQELDNAVQNNLANMASVAAA